MFCLQVYDTCLNVMFSFTVVGGTAMTPFGTFAEYAVVERDQVLLTPDHLDDVHAAAWPLAAVTAWRYTFQSCCIQSEG